MISRIIDEVRMAMSHELYLSALALALTLPDTCGRAEYPNEKRNGIRYKTWFSQYVITDRCDSPYGQYMPYLNEEIIYSLKCLKMKYRIKKIKWRMLIGLSEWQKSI